MINLVYAHCSTFTIMKQDNRITGSGRRASVETTTRLKHLEMYFYLENHFTNGKIST